MERQDVRTGMPASVLIPASATTITFRALFRSFAISCRVLPFSNLMGIIVVFNPVEGKLRKAAVEKRDEGERSVGMRRGEERDRRDGERRGFCRSQSRGLILAPVASMVDGNPEKGDEGSSGFARGTWSQPRPSVIRLWRAAPLPYQPPQGRPASPRCGAWVGAVCGFREV